MTAKAYLSQIERLGLMIWQREEERDELRHSHGISGIDYSKPAVQSSPKGGAGYERIVERLAEMDVEIERLIGEYAETKHRMIGEIQSLPRKNHVEVLYKRYVECKSLDRIAREMEYSYEWVRHVHGRVLDAKGNESSTHKNTF